MNDYVISEVDNINFDLHGILLYQKKLQTSTFYSTEYRLPVVAYAITGYHETFAKLKKL